MDFVVRYDARWLVIDEDVVREPWLEKSTLAVLSRSPGADPDLSGPLREQLTGLLDMHDRHNPAGMYALYPTIDDGVVAIAQIFVAPTEPGLGLPDAVAPVLMTDDDEVDLVEAPEVTQLVDGAAPATRVRQRYTDRNSERRVVKDLVIYLWLVPGDCALLTLTSTFFDPLLASRWQDALDELARGVRLQETPS